MQNTALPLPDSLDAAHAMIAALRQQNGTLEAAVSAHQSTLSTHEQQISYLTVYIEKLKHQLAVLRKGKFGASSERLAREIEQLELLLGESEETSAAEVAAAEELEGTHLANDNPSAAPETPKQKPTRKPFPAHLPREEVLHEAAGACPCCGSGKLVEIGCDSREVLDYVPASFKVIVHVRPKMACRDCEAITQPAVPSLPILRGTAGAGLLAQVMLAKYCDHLPLYRQSGIYAREGIELERSTLASWAGTISTLLTPLAGAIEAYVKQGSSLHADDTPVPVLSPGSGSTKTGRLWVAVRDERGFGSAAPPAVYYRYSPDRKSEQAAHLLAGATGYLHADGYAGFKRLYEGKENTQPQFTEVACWAHARRKLVEVAESQRSVAAKALLGHIAQLFAIEQKVNGKPSEERQAARQTHSQPILATLKSEMEATLARISGKSVLAQAIRYSLSRWQALTRYTANGTLEMTNNAAERAIRPLALGRKNWLFAGSDAGGARAAVFYTLIQTARLNGLNPYTYLRDIIERIGEHPARRIDELLPWKWNLINDG